MQSFTFRAQVFSLKKPEIFLTKVEQMPYKTQEHYASFYKAEYSMCVCMYLYWSDKLNPSFLILMNYFSTK